jgi:hypothetical protein
MADPTEEIPQLFTDWLQTQVSALAEELQVSSRDAFPIWALIYFHQVDRDDAAEKCDTCNSSGVSGDGGLDGWYYDRDDERAFYLIQAKYADDPITKTFGAHDHLRDLPGVVRRLLEDELSTLPEKLQLVAEALREAVKDEATIVVEYFLAGQISSTMETELESVAKLLPAELHIETMPDLYNEFVGRETTQDLSGESLQVCMTSPDMVRPSVIPEGIASAATVMLDVNSLGKGARPLGRRLFSGNVRYELSRSNAFNKGMRKTLADEPDSFGFYNNGITIICDGFDVKEVNGESSISIENPQVVNGCQTVTAVIASRNRVNPGDSEVQARVIAINGDINGEDRSRLIAQYTNSQSPVQVSDLRANETLQADIQANFRLLEPKVFYERKRGEWLSLSAPQQNPYAGRKVSMINIGQRFRAWIGEPAAAFARKGELFADLGIHKQVFSRSIDPRNYLLAYEAFQYYDELLAPKNSDRLVAVNGGLADEALQSRLRQARKAVAAHLSELTREVFERRYGSLTPVHAAALREQLKNEDFMRAIAWGTLACIQDFMAAHPAPANLKSLLQSEAALVELRNNLAKYLSGPMAILTQLPELEA